jgi:hypothetical protein
MMLIEETNKPCPVPHPTYINSESNPCIRWKKPTTNFNHLRSLCLCETFILRNTYKLYVRKVKERNNTKNFDIDEKIKWIIRIQNGGKQTHSYASASQLFIFNDNNQCIRYNFRTNVKIVCAVLHYLTHRHRTPRAGATLVWTSNASQALVQSWEQQAKQTFTRVATVTPGWMHKATGPELSVVQHAGSATMALAFASPTAFENKTAQPSRTTTLPFHFLVLIIHVSKGVQQ